MADVTVKHLDELDSYAGQFLYAGRGLGVTAWGMNVARLPAGWQDYPEHDHAEQGQEEVYVVLEGSARLAAARGAGRDSAGVGRDTGKALRAEAVTTVRVSPPRHTCWPPVSALRRGGKLR